MLVNLLPDIFGQTSGQKPVRQLVTGHQNDSGPKISQGTKPFFAYPAIWEGAKATDLILPFAYHNGVIEPLEVIFIAAHFNPLCGVRLQSRIDTLTE